ncbi:Pre-mRNA-splicing factor SPF27 [Xylaria intraflava]|nr:Pre-mRNA-splicing factor SPF27 [Xylaria intraflava]
MTSSIRTTVHESLPYIDKDPTPEERKAAQAEIDSELTTTKPEPAEPHQEQTFAFTPAIQAELERIKQGLPLKAIDQTRYELQENPQFQPLSQDQAPSTNQDNSQSTNQENPEPTPLTKAYTTATYLSHRKQNLHLLEAYGKTAWLTSNWQAEADLASLERDLASRKREVDVLSIRRRRQQDDVADELAGLEAAWQRGVGRVLETEVATEALRQQVRARQRGSS